MKTFLACTVAALVLAHPAFAAESKIEIKAEDTPASLLAKAVGQKVELHLKNGAKLAGKVESANATSVHLSNLTGQEFFDAVIAAADVTAVVVRVR